MRGPSFGPSAAGGQSVVRASVGRVTPLGAVLGALGGLVLVWLAFLAVLVCARPRGASLLEAVRLVPDVLRLVKRMAADPQLSRGVRVRLGLLLLYLALPVDLVPDFIPVIGYADDAIVVALVLRGVVRRAGPQALEDHWPGTPEGLATLRRVAGLAA